MADLEHIIPPADIPPTRDISPDDIAEQLRESTQQWLRALEAVREAAAADRRSTLEGRP